jgi:2-dehydro-3-deoxy-D-gluconate 5-dehydrogenase
VAANEPTITGQASTARGPLRAGQRAIVTGAWGGIGGGIARGLRAEGATVVGIGRSEPTGALEPAGPLRSAVVAELTSRDECAEAFAVSLEQLGGLDILVTAHGHVRPAPAAEVDPEDWDLTFASNLGSVFQLSQLAYTVMEPQRRGKIIHIASMYAFFGGLRVAPYAASKGGVAQLTKSLALEWAPLGINVNAVAPGYVRTKLNRHIWDDPERAAQVITRIPAGRWGEPEDLAGSVVFLASGLSDYIHGVVLPVDGGYLAR